MRPLVSRFLPLAALALVGVAAAGWTAISTTHPQDIPTLTDIPPQGPWEQRIAATGLIESDGNETRIGVPEEGLVAKVAMRSGQQVRAGDLLFSLDDRLVQAEVAVAEAELAAMRGELLVAQAGLAIAQAGEARLQALPRSEDAAPAAARAAVAEAQLADARIQRQRIERLGPGNASAEEIDLRRGAEKIALAQVASAQADLAHARLPAWMPDLAAARAEVAMAQGRLAASTARVAVAESRLAAIQARLVRLSIRSPCDATVIATQVMPGVVASPGDDGLVVLADVRQLLLRLEVDESQVSRLRPGAPAKAWLRGNREQVIDLAFERIEPRAESRRALAGKPGERLDGRAVQVLYRLADPPAYLRPGLLLEADIAVTAP